MQHRINERAINGALARVLTDEAHLNVIPEATTSTSGGRAPDLVVTPHAGQHRRVAIEAKIGIDGAAKSAAVADAMARLSQMPDVYAAIALCYPQSIAEAIGDASTLDADMYASKELTFVEVTEDGPAGEWFRGGWSELGTSIVYAGEAVAQSIVTRVDQALTEAVNCLSDGNKRNIAFALDLPGEVSKRDEQYEFDYEDFGNHYKAAKIGCLLVFNGMLMHSRLIDAGVLAKGSQRVTSFEYCLDEPRFGPKAAFLTAWRGIREIDYNPIFDPATAALDAFPTAWNGREAIALLAAAAQAIANEVADINSDLAGRIYHRLLGTAPFDGSYYTSTPAAILLARLALSQDFVDWSDANEVINLRICDPACGTGTLLMAAAQICRERHLLSNGDPESHHLMHLHMIEDVLRGMDINLSAVHLAASTLALTNPRVDFGKMGIYRAKFGVERNDGANGSKAWLGSLEMLRGREPRLPFPDFERQSGNGEEMEYPDLHKKCDVVIMNPPFTRDSLRHDQLSVEDENLMRRAEETILLQTDRPELTDRSSNQPMFTLLADELCRDGDGVYAIVMPSTVGTGASARNQRVFLNEKWHVETVITSHDPRRTYFSENTSITESLMVARRRGDDETPRATRFINIAANPDSSFKALSLAADAERGDFANWGTVYWNGAEHMDAGDWLPMLFYNGELTDATRSLKSGCSGRLKPLGDMASLAPGGRSVRDTFRRVRVRQSPDMRALWRHETSERTTMAASPDCAIAAKVGEESAAAARWAHASRLLIANRFRCNLTRITSALCDTPVLGSAWESVTPNDFSLDPDTIAAAWCIWSNSSAGILGMLAIRQRDFTYPRFSMDGLRSLPFPDPDAVPESITALASAYDALAESTLLPLPQAHECATRAAIDSAVADALGPDLADIHKWRDLISHEPNVSNRPAEVATT